MAADTSFISKIRAQLTAADCNDISTRHFLDVYRDIAAFLATLGSMFGFVTSDVNEKIAILERLLTEHGAEFSTLSKMVEWEVANGKTLEPKPSGSRTLLRLLRALEFITTFLVRLEANSADATSATAHGAYSDTLAKHHSWLVRKAVGAALYTLPYREQVLVNMMGADADGPAQLGSTLQFLVTVHKSSIIHFDRHNLHALP